MDFATAWTRLTVGEMVTVRDGQIEPQVTDSLEWKVWASRNFTGELMAKADDPLQVLRFQTVIIDVAVLSHEVTASLGYTFERVTPALEDVQDARKLEVEALRTTTMDGGCPCTIGTIDSNLQSRLYVAGAVTMAQIAIAQSQPFAMRWRLIDNTYADLDAFEMITMGVELGMFVNACCQVSFDLKDEIGACTTIEKVAAIDISSPFAAVATSGE